MNTQHTTDAAAVQKLLDEEVTAWNNGDAEAYSRYFATDGTFTNILGKFFTGHKMFVECHNQIFKGPFAKTVMDQKIISLKFLGTNAAVVETLTSVTGFANGSPLPGVYINERGQLYTRLLQVLEKTGNGWLIVAYHNTDLKAGIPVPEAQ